ncbi:MAG TPA: ATP-binding protein [Puia sp.]|jgi:signal transduction histidine kinase/ligand-binding sensor domain-containing protein
MRLIKPSTSILPLLLLTLCLHAQTFTRVYCRHLSTQSGLSAGYVRKVVQDPYGFIWIATEDGLNRFDGRNMLLYNKGLPRRHSLTGSDVWDLALDTANHFIWAINAFGGIDAIDYLTGNTSYSFSQTENKTTAHLRFITLALIDSQLYIGSTDGVFVLNTTSRQLKKIPLPNPFAAGNTALPVDKLYADRKGQLWLFCREAGVLILDKNTLHVTGFIRESQLGGAPTSHLWFYDCDEWKDGHLVVATNKGLRAFSRDSHGALITDNNPFPYVPATQGNDVYACRQDAHGDIWFSAVDCLAKIDPRTRTWSFIREHTSLDEYRWVDAAFDIYFDKDDNLWLGCQQGLLFAENRPACFVSIHKSALSEAVIQHAYYINPVNDSLVYCCAQDGLYQINPVTGSILSLGSRPFYHVFTDPFHRLIASSVDGCFCIDGGRHIAIASLYPEFRPLGKIITNSHCSIGDSLLLFGTENNRGVVVWNYRSHHASIIDKSSVGLYLKENTVNGIRKDSKGHIWVLCDNTVSILDFPAGKMRSLNTRNPALKKTYSIFMDFCEVGGRYYLASYGSGVLLLDSQYHYIREISVADGLSSNNIYKLLGFRDSLLFVTSNNGLSAVDIRHNYRIRKYYSGDGLHSDNFEENSGAVREGTLYAGGPNGLTIINPLLLAHSYPPPRVFLRRIETQTTSGVTDTSNLRLTSLDIPNNAQQTTVSFTGFNFAHPEREVFAYRIKELKSDWIALGNRDFINFIGQQPGEYTLEIRAEDDLGQPIAQPLELLLSFQPKWFQTAWFKILIVLLIGGIFYSIYRYRLLQLQKQQQIRKDIASDLHDDIGGTLNSVKMFTHLAQRTAEKDQHLARIEESLTQANINLRDLIWVLDDTQDTIQELLDRIKRFALPICQANSITMESLVEDHLHHLSLSKATKRNLLLIAKEAITNALKYAGCQCISLQIKKDGNKLIFCIRDDGKGFDREGEATGHGLNNMRQRAAQIRYHIEILTRPGAGTTIVLTEK